jgi:hypothetical protein
MIDIIDRKQDAADRRDKARYKIVAPAILKAGVNDIWAMTTDISARGIYFRTSETAATLTIGETLEFTVRITPIVTSARPSFLVGRGSIVRVELNSLNEVEMAIEVVEFEIDADTYPQRWT